MSDYSNYDDLVNKINNSLSESDAQFEKVSDAAASDCDINVILNNVNNMQVVKNNAGEVIGYDYVHTYRSAPNTREMSIDSNTDEGRFFGGGQTRGGGAGRFSGSYYDSQGELKSGAVDEQGNQVNTLSGYVSPEWSAVSVLAKLGINVNSSTAQAIEQLGTNVADTFLDLFTKIGYIPEEYTDAARTLYHVDDQGNTTMYMDEDMIGALAIQAREDGFFNTGEPIYPPSVYPVTITSIGNIMDALNTAFSYIPTEYDFNDNMSHIQSFINQYAGKACKVYLDYPNSSNAYEASTALYIVVYPQVTIGTIISSASQSYSGLPKLIYKGKRTRNGGVFTFTYNTTTTVSEAFTYGCYITSARHLVVGNCNVQSDPLIPGVSQQDDSTSMVDAITGADPHVVAQNLATRYPNVMGSPISVTVMDNNCQPVTKKYYAVPISYSPTNVGVNAPITGGLQVNPSFNPDVGIDLPDIDLSKYVEEVINQLSGSGAGRDIVKTTPNDDGTVSVVTLPATVPKTGEGDAPAPVTPQVPDTPLWHVYHPSSSEAQAFGAWLWSSNIIDQIVRIFQNPLDGVIGLHAIYATPSTSGSAYIVCGNVTSNVSAEVVSSQYITVQCGSIWLTEYFGNVFDYSPYTSISLFLPFIGIVPLNPADVMRAQLTITYNIDVYTGACIAMVDVERDGAGGVIYQFSGNCAVSFPTSAVSYNSIFSSMISIAAGIATAAAATATPVAIGGAAAAAHGVFSAKQDVSKSGAFTANAGAMGPKKPYLIITRPQENMALNYQDYDGRGANQTVMLKDIHGYARCKIVHINIPQAFGNELKEIHDILTTGVILP